MILHHIAIIVSSEKSLEFYNLFGFKEVFRKVRKADTVVLMEGNGIQLEVFIDPNHPDHTEPEPYGIRHFALQTEETLEKEIERIRNESTETINVSPIMEDWTGVRFCFINDPDSTKIELREKMSAD